MGPNLPCFNYPKVRIQHFNQHRKTHFVFTRFKNIVYRDVDGALNYGVVSLFFHCMLCKGKAKFQGGYSSFSRLKIPN